MFSINEKKKVLINNLALLMIECVLLSYSAWLHQRRDGFDHGFQNSINLMLAGEVFMMLGYLTLFGAYFTNTKFVPMGSVGLLCVGFVLMFFSLCTGYQFYNNSYDQVASTWWQEMGLGILGAINAHTFYELNNNQNNADYQRA